MRAIWLTMVLYLMGASASAQPADQAAFDQIVQDYQACQRHHKSVDLTLTSRLGTKLGVAPTIMTTVTTDYASGWEFCVAQEKVYHQAVAAHMDAQHLNMAPPDADTLARKGQYQ